MIDLEVLITVAVIIALAEAVTEELFKPIRENLIQFWPALEAILDTSTKYVAWILAGVFLGLSGITLFPELLPGMGGVVVTAIVAGIGANRLHDILNIPKQFAREQVLAAAAFEEWADTMEDFPVIEDLPEG